MVTRQVTVYQDFDYTFDLLPAHEQHRLRNGNGYMGYLREKDEVEPEVREINLDDKIPALTDDEKKILNKPCEWSDWYFGPMPPLPPTKKELREQCEKEIKYLYRYLQQTGLLKEAHRQHLDIDWLFKGCKIEEFQIEDKIMKPKEIEQCQHINLSTSPKDIFQTMQLEQPTVDYFFHKDYGGHRKYKVFEDKFLDKALEEKESQLTDISEWISHKGNRWMSYLFAEYFPKARYAQAWPTSFIYYETYASCGAFFPIFRKSDKTKKIDRMIGIVIYTDHFFLRMSERTGKAYRSRELIREFITTMQTHAAQADEDGEVIVKFKGGYGWGKRRSEDPQTFEVRTFLRDEELNNNQRRKVEKLNAYAELMEDGMFLNEVALHTAYHDEKDEKELNQEFFRKYKAAQKLGMEKTMMLAGLAHMSFLRIMADILHMKFEEITTAQNVYIGQETQECFAPFVEKYKDLNTVPTKEQEAEQTRDLLDCMAAAAKKLKLRSMTREAIEESFKRIASGKE